MRKKNLDMYGVYALCRVAVVIRWAKPVPLSCSLSDLLCMLLQANYSFYCTSGIILLTFSHFPFVERRLLHVTMGESSMAKQACPPCCVAACMYACTHVLPIRYSVQGRAAEIEPWPSSVRDEME